MKNIAILGAGSHTRSSINLLKQFFKNASFKIYDDSFNSEIDELIHAVKIVGTISQIDAEKIIFLSIGDNKKREEYFRIFDGKVLKENLFHFTAIQEDNIKIGMSNQVFAHTYINSYVEIGNNNIINTSSILEHEVKIGDHNHISIGVKLCGKVKIGNRCMIGAGSIIIDKISICDDVLVGAGSVVVEDILESGTYVGNPARKIR